MMAKPVEIASIDHFVLTVADIAVTTAFYEKTLGMGIERFRPADRSAERVALKFGTQKINLHQAGTEFKPHARKPVAGSGDFCLITETPIDEVKAHLIACGVTVELGPVPRTGATGRLSSIYFRDPDGNLVEVANLN
jgi:catechol 2,3-dioxygenase-like lactoylglutathione lyase family enzyme